MVAVKSLPLPKRPETKSVSVVLPKALYEAARREMRRRRMTVRQVVRWGLQQFLLTSNPTAAAKLGIGAEPESEA